MHDETVDFFPWLDPNAPDSIVDFKMPEVKEESHTDFSLFSPPSSPFITNSVLASQSVRQRTAKSESPRTRPYPELHHSEDTIGMSGTSGSGYDNWSNRSRGSNERRSSVGGYPLYQSATYDASNSSSSKRLSRSSSSSASSSSFNGAVGPSSSGPDTRFVTVSPRHSDAQLSMSWHQNQMPMGTTSDLLYPIVAGDISYHSSSDTDHGGYTAGVPSSTTIYPYDETTTPVTGYAPTTFNGSTSHSHAPQDHDLLRRIAELEEQHLRDREQIRALQGQLQSFSSTSSGSPSSPPTTQYFQASWAARTAARIKYLCSLNRAGNALCAWHDPRRERRAYPPRHAPPNTLNCGCTYEEALFEESLARHKVGSYLPGDNARMDPALRNPLLRLLQQRYGYRDGDFERDPFTGDWITEDGHKEGHEHWERLLASGINPRRPRGDHRNTSL